MAILITNGVRERDLGMVMVFCHPNHAKMEAWNALSALCQHDSSEPSVVVIRRYSNTHLSAPGLSRDLTPPPGTSSLWVSSLPDILLSGTFPKIKVGSKHSSIQGDNHMSDLTPETRTSSA